MGQGKPQKFRDSGEFEITEFEIADSKWPDDHYKPISKWLKTQGQNQGKWVWVRDSGEFEITEFEIAGIYCNTTHSDAKFIKILKINFYRQVYSPAHQTRLWFSGPTGGFTNLLIRLRVRRRRLTMYFESEYQDFIFYMRLTCSC